MFFFTLIRLFSVSRALFGGLFIFCQNLTFAESALYLASRNNNNWTTEWTTKQRRFAAGKYIGIKNLQKIKRDSSHPDHFFCKKMVNEACQGFAPMRDYLSSFICEKIVKKLIISER